MADRELQTILNSGEINSIYIGGTASSDKAVTAGDVQASILGVGTASILTEQVLVPDTAEKLVWLSSEFVLIGTDFSTSVANDEVTIITSGTYTVGGSINITAPINDVISITLYVNGLATPFKSEGIGRGVDTTTTIVYYGVTTFNSADVVSLYVESTGSSVIVDSASAVFEKIA